MKKVIMILLILCVICIGCGKKNKQEENVDEPVLVIDEQEEQQEQTPEININIPGETTTIETTNTSNASEPIKAQTTTESKSDKGNSTTIINNYTTNNNGSVDVPNVVNPTNNNKSNSLDGLKSAFDRLKNLATSAYGSAKNWYEENDVPATIDSYIYDLDEQKLQDLKNGILDLYDEKLGGITTQVIGEEGYNEYKNMANEYYDSYTGELLQGYSENKEDITGYVDHFKEAPLAEKLAMLQEILGSL